MTTRETLYYPSFYVQLQKVDIKYVFLNNQPKSEVGFGVDTCTVMKLEKCFYICLGTFVTIIGILLQEEQHS